MFNWLTCLHSVPEIKACQLAVEKALQSPASPDRFVPRCKEDGRFEEVQCSEVTGECWCVDSLGVEQRGTRSRDFITCPGMGKYESVGVDSETCYLCVLVFSVYVRWTITDRHHVSETIQKLKFVLVLWNRLKLSFIWKENFDHTYVGLSGIRLISLNSY